MSDLRNRKTTIWLFGLSLLYCAGSPLADVPTDVLRRELAKRVTPPPTKEQGVGALTAADAALAAVSWEALYREVVVREKVIYGTDNRTEASAQVDRIIVRNVRATAALVRSSHLAHVGDSWQLHADNASAALALCPEERFGAQPAAAFCTGVLVRPDVVVTAGHCVPSAEALGSFYVVFGYVMTPQGRAPGGLAADLVYSATALLGRQEDAEGVDWAAIRLDRMVTGRLPVTARTSAVIPDGAALYVVGCPMGVPLKYADKAIVRQNDQPGYFIANLDTYGGNSGAPVFGRNGDVEGILARGEKDFVMTPAGCRASLHCPKEGCRGESVVRIRRVPRELFP